MENIGQFVNNDELRIILDVVIASILTMFVGVEREWASKAAGIRTNMIVGGFTCLVVSLTDPLLDFLITQNASKFVETDPVRVLQAIVVGVSFIGAGTIIKSTKESRVTGITTAATLLYSIGIGMSVAIRHYLLAIFLTAFILIINKVINILAKKFTSMKD